MQMTEDEIVRKYKESKQKKGYIQILAELNACDKSVIIEILKKHNIGLPGNPNFSKPDANPGHIRKVESEAKKEEENKLTNTGLMVPIEPVPIEPPKKEIIMNTKITIPDTVKIVIENEINRLKKEKEEIDQKIRELQDFIKKNS